MMKFYTYMPWPFRHVSLSLLSGVESLLSAPGPGGRGEDSDGLGILGDEATHLVGAEAAVAVGGAAARTNQGDKKKRRFSQSYLSSLTIS